jgi:transcriptional regulator with XRE-family HTH domain
MFPQNQGMPPKKISNVDLRERERVGATLRLTRTREGWKLGDFATELGISYAYLSNIEAGRKPLPDHLLARACKLLDCPPLAIKRPDREAVA